MGHGSINKDRNNSNINKDMEQKILQIESELQLPRNSPLTWDHLKSRTISSYNLFHRFIGYIPLALNFKFFPGLKIVVDGKENIPKREPRIYTMNHTDNSNYFPLLYTLIRNNNDFTIWIKGKNYKNPFQRRLFDFGKMIPVPPKNYLLTTIHQRLFPDSRELNSKKELNPEIYQQLKDSFDGTIDVETLREQHASSEVITIAQKMDDIRWYHDQCMQQVGRITENALLEKRISLLIFPEGTRNVTLGKARTGIAQIALYTKVPVIPIACDYGDLIYPGHNPFAKKGTIVYHIGKPMTIDDQLKPYKIDEPYALLSTESQTRHKPQFEGATTAIMTEINRMLHPRHQNNELYKR